MFIFFPASRGERAYIVKRDKIDIVKNVYILFRARM